MDCPRCGSGRIRVLETLPHRRNHPARIYRRRRCLECRARWRTVELLDLGSPNNGQTAGTPWRNPASADNGRRGQSAARAAARPLAEPPEAVRPPTATPPRSAREVAARVPRLPFLD